MTTQPPDGFSTEVWLLDALERYEQALAEHYARSTTRRIKLYQAKAFVRWALKGQWPDYSGWEHRGSL